MWPHAEKVMTMTTTAADTILKNWSTLNEFLKSCEDDTVLRNLLDRERQTKRRRTFAIRIFHRINRLRTIQETAKLRREFSC